MSGSSSTVTFRVLKSSWGISITLTASWSPLGNDSLVSFPLSASVQLLLSQDIAERIGAGGADQLIRGFTTALGSVEPRRVRPYLVVEELRYAESDFQLEGLAAAAYEWIRGDLSLGLPSVRADFDSGANRYLIEFS